MSIAIPRIRDFRGLSPRSFDGRGSYSLGVKEQVIFPEIEYDSIDQVRGLDITITTSAQTDAEAFALLMAFGMPFSTKWRPKGFDEAIGVESEPTDEDGARVSTPAAAEQPAEVEEASNETGAAKAEAVEASATEQEDAPGDGDADTTEKESSD